MSLAMRRCSTALIVSTALISASAFALDFRAVADQAAILYDAPSARSSKLYVVNKGYPLEIIVTVEGWSKVRDANGSFAWIENRQLTDRRTVMIKVPVAQVRQKPEDNAPVAFQAQQSVILEVVDTTTGWVQVRHRDGGTGFVKAQQVWGV